MSRTHLLVRASALVVLGVVSPVAQEPEWNPAVITSREVMHRAANSFA